MPFKVESQIPNVSVVEPFFDFGKLTTLGNPGYLSMTLVNQSPMAAILILDLRESATVHGSECLDIQFLSSSITK